MSTQKFVGTSILGRRLNFKVGWPDAYLVSSKGQIVLPAAMRRRLGMGAGARIAVVEESDGLKPRVVRAVAPADVAKLAGMVKARARGGARRLEDFDPASLLTRSPRCKS